MRIEFPKRNGSEVIKVSKFNLRLRELRKQEKLTQQELADNLGISKSSVNMYERGEREPGLDLLETTANFFDVSVDYLVGKSTEMGKRIRQAREKMLLSQEDLGRPLGLNKSTIQRYESGEVQRIKIPILENLAKILNVNPNWIILKTDDPINYDDVVDNLNVKIDYRGLDEALEKVSRLNELLKETIELINSLKK